MSLVACRSRLPVATATTTLVGDLLVDDSNYDLLDMFLMQRDELINGTNERKQEILMDLLKRSGLMAAGALPVSVFLAVLLLMVPGLSVVLGPLGLLGSVGLSLRLVTSLVRNPTQQEKYLLTSIQGYMRGMIYDFKRDKDGSITIDVVALPAA